MADGTLGAVRITRIHETFLTETASSWLVGFDREAVHPHLPWFAPDHYDPAADRITLPVHSWLLRDGRRTALIDACCGNAKSRPGIAEMDGLDTPYLARLAAAGVQPEEVDYVLCTHLHLDHVGWNTRRQDGGWVPTFPNARYVMSDVELAHALCADSAMARTVYVDSIAPVVEAGQAMTVSGVDMLEDLLLIRPAPGHSPGHVRFELRSQGQLAVFCGDILHSPIQAPFWRWNSLYCEDKPQAAETRRALLEFAVEEDALLLPGHFNGAHVGRVRREGEAFRIRFGWD